MNLILILILKLTASAWSQGQPPRIVRTDLVKYRVEQEIKKVSINIAPIQRKKHWSFSAEALTSVKLENHYGGSAEISYQFNYFGLDLRATKGWTSYQAIHVDPGAVAIAANSTYASADHPEAERQRHRESSDQWDYLIEEIGASVAAKLGEGWLSKWSTRSRFSVGLGQFEDRTRKVSFDAKIALFEESLYYHFSDRLPLAFKFSLGFHTGFLESRPDHWTTQQAKRLPVNWVTSSLGIQYWF